MSAQVQTAIENNFRTQVKNDDKVKNAYLLVHSDKLGIHLNIAEGDTSGVAAHPQQPNYLASVGKLFTATIIAIFHEKGLLSFDDLISKYLDNELMAGLHVFGGKDYSNKIKISHLLNQSSGLDDVFYHLLKKVMENSEHFSPREAVIWGKENLTPKFKPGEKHHYTDTNYHLLGLIVESITGKPFFEALHEYIFNPLKMKRAYMMGYSQPAENSNLPLAKFYLDGVDGSTIDGLAQIDYAGGGVVTTLEEYLVFMRSLVNQEIIEKNTLERMMTDDFAMGFPSIGVRYGYSIWKFVTTPIIMPKKFNCWGCVGVTGAFMFYHPQTEAYIIGSFNDVSYQSKALRFMISKIIKELLAK